MAILLCPGKARVLSTQSCLVFSLLHISILTSRITYTLGSSHWTKNISIKTIIFGKTNDKHDVITLVFCWRRCQPSPASTSTHTRTKGLTLCLSRISQHRCQNFPRFVIICPKICNIVLTLALPYCLFTGVYSILLCPLLTEGIFQLIII